MERVTYVWKNQAFSILKWYLMRMCISWLRLFNVHLKPILKHMFSSRPSSLAHKLLMLLFMLASLVRADQVFSTLLVPVGKQVTIIPRHWIFCVLFHVLLLMLDRSFGGPPYYCLAGVHLTVTSLSLSILRTCMSNIFGFAIFHWESV